MGDNIYDPRLNGKQYKMSIYVGLQFLKDMYIQKQLENKQNK